ncbi:MAG: alpha-amylase family glycosyl hydrolase, partial [Terracidiphilus sp.]
MAKIVATFTFHSGVRQNLFQNVRLSGSWDANGIFSNQWTQTPMVVSSDETGCDAFTASVSMDASQVGTRFEWGVIADLASAQNSWVVVTEVADPNSAQQTRSFILSAAGGRQDYWFATGRRFGAQKYTPTGATKPGIRFSVWAPFAQSVEVVFAPFPAAPATPSGYIADDGTGVDPTASVVPLTQIGTTGIWETSVTTTPALADFSAFMNRLYMYRIVNEQHGATYKVDIFSRNQVGRGNNNPNGAQYAGSYLDLDGIVSCSVVSDPDLVTQDFDDAGVEKQSLIPADEFWANDLNPAKPLPLAIEDLVIYELHIGSLGFPSTAPGKLAEAMTFIDQLVELGVNAVELLPMEQSDGAVQWGYGTSLFFCLQTSQGGGNQLKHFIRACHQRGIAVILDVVYNHFAGSGNDRSEWGYDSDPNVAPQHNT